LAGTKAETRELRTLRGCLWLEGRWLLLLLLLPSCSLRECGLLLASAPFPRAPTKATRTMSLSVEGMGGVERGVSANGQNTRAGSSMSGGASGGPHDRSSSAVVCLVLRGNGRMHGKNQIRRPGRPIWSSFKTETWL